MTWIWLRFSPSTRFRGPRFRSSLSVLRPIPSSSANSVVLTKGEVLSITNLNNGVCEARVLMHLTGSVWRKCGIPWVSGWNVQGIPRWSQSCAWWSLCPRNSVNLRHIQTINFLFRVHAWMVVDVGEVGPQGHARIVIILRLNLWDMMAWTSVKLEQK